MEVENPRKRLRPETRLPKDSVPNKRSRDAAFSLFCSPFSDDDLVFREFLEEQNLPLYPDIIYLSDDDEPLPGEPEEEEEERWWLKPRVEPLTSGYRDSAPSLRAISLKIKPDFCERPLDAIAGVSRHMDEGCGHDSGLFGEHHPNGIGEQQHNHYSIEHSGQSKPLSGSASNRRSWIGSRFLVPIEVYDHEAPAQKIVSETESDANDVPGVAFGGAVALELAYLHFEEGRDSGLSIFQERYDGNRSEHPKFAVIRDFQPGCGSQTLRLARTEPQLVEVVEDNFQLVEVVEDNFSR